MKKRKIYEYIIAYVLLAVFAIDLVCIVLRFTGGYQISLPRGLIENFLVVYIVIFESANSQKIIRTINFALLPLALFGFIFIIQHWPFGKELFFCSLFLVLMLLLTDAIKRERSKSRLLILAFALMHYFVVLISVYRLPVKYMASVIELAFVGIESIVLFSLLFRHNDKPHHAGK